MVLAVGMYLLLPAVFAAHVAVAHPGEAAALVEVYSGEHHDTEHGDHDGESERDGPYCDLCNLVGTLGASGDIAEPASVFAFDVTSPQNAFAPQAFCLPADPRVTPASPRAPPRL